MGALIRIAPAILLLPSVPAGAEEVGRWRPMMEDASVRFGIPARWIEHVIRAESGGRTMLNGQPIRSSAGAMGLMQLMPATWAEMRARLALGRDPDDPRDNILAGTFYLRLMYQRFGYPGLFGAYNAGPGAYAAWLAGTKKLPRETIAYLKSVSGASPSMPNVVPAVASPPALFVVRNAVPAEQSARQEKQPQASLFVFRSNVP